MRTQHHVIFDGDTETASVDEHWAQEEGFDLRRPAEPQPLEETQREEDRRTFLGDVENGLKTGAKSGDIAGALGRAGRVAWNTVRTLTTARGGEMVANPLIGYRAVNTLTPLEAAVTGMTQGEMVVAAGAQDLAMGALGVATVAEAPLLVPVALGVGGGILAAAAAGGATGAATGALNAVGGDALHALGGMRDMALELEHSGQDLVNRLWQSGAASSTDPPIPTQDLGSLNGQPALGPDMMVQADPTVDPRSFETQRAAAMPGHFSSGLGRSPPISMPSRNKATRSEPGARGNSRSGPAPSFPPSRAAKEAYMRAQETKQLARRNLNP